MHIPQELPQFTDNKSLIIVASRQNGILYTAHNGEMEKVVEWEIKDPQYSDKEGTVEGGRWKSGIRAMGGIFRGGMPKENIKETVEKDFLKEFDEHLKNNWDPTYTGIYLFASPYVVNDIPKRMTQEQNNKIKKTVEGNYIKIHPVELLKKLQ